MNRISFFTKDNCHGRIIPSCYHGKINNYLSSGSKNLPFYCDKLNNYLNCLKSFNNIIMRQIVAIFLTALLCSGLSAQQRVSSPPSDSPREVEFSHAGKRGGFQVGVYGLNGTIGDVLEYSGSGIDVGYRFFFGFTDQLTTLFAFDLLYGPNVAIAGPIGLINPVGNLIVVNVESALAWYFIPSNVFISGGLLLSLGGVQESVADFTANPGLGFALSAGKDFRISSRVLVGAGYKLRYSSMGLEDYSLAIMEGERFGLFNHGLYMTLSWFSRK